MWLLFCIEIICICFGNVATAEYIGHMCCQSLQHLASLGCLGSLTTVLAKDFNLVLAVLLEIFSQRHSLKFQKYYFFAEVQSSMCFISWPRYLKFSKIVRVFS